MPDVTTVEDNACSNESLALIPSNVTRLGDLPANGYPFIAIAPWTESACVQSYLSLMRMEAARGVFFYHDDGDNTRPPPVSDPSWNLRDGGRWKGENQFPIYALPGAIGSTLMTQLSLYSGNMSSAPHGDELTQIYDPDQLIRLFTRVNISTSGGIPSLWVFLIIVLAILLAIVLLTSVVMHLVQRRQRTLLQRRVARGEVDLEALGIKRLNVPQDELDKMPQYIFTNKTEAVPVVQGKAPPPPVPFSQPTCPICLDDYVHGETIIRELPCKHIFHPECIDPFLRDNSSLCPVCKKSALPAGYCPVNVTNLMVRRERLIRRMRQRSNPESSTSRVPLIGSVARRVRTLSVPVDPENYPRRSRVHSHGAYHGNAEMINVMSTRDRQNSTPAQPAPIARTGTTLSPVQSPSADAEQIPAEIRAQGTHARRAWLRERLASRQQQQYNENHQQAERVDVGRPMCKLLPPLVNEHVTDMVPRATCWWSIYPKAGIVEEPAVYRMLSILCDVHLVRVNILV